MGKTKEFLEDLFSKEKVSEIEFRGKCHDCGREVSIVVSLDEEGTLNVSGGALWYTFKVFAKCESCFKKSPVLTDYQPCEVYSRIVGYMRPVSQWNPGKKEEYKSRTPFSVKSEIEQYQKVIKNQIDKL
mgnify:CR=1 FL=1